LVGAPATTVMTTDITALMMDVGTILLGRDPNGVAFARTRARRTWPPIVGFNVCCSLRAPFSGRDGGSGPWRCQPASPFWLLRWCFGRGCSRRTELICQS
jgi:hypothetical protein